MARVLTPKGEATRRRIVEGAAILIRERGVAEVGLDDIRAGTSTSKSQLFHYFPDGKAQLLRGVAEHEAVQVIADQQPELEQLTSWDSWDRWRVRVIEKYRAQGQYCPLGALTAELGTSSPEARAIVVDLFDTWRGHLLTGVRALKERGEIDAETDDEHAATAVLNAVTGGANMMRTTGDISYLEVGLANALERLRLPA